uniref:Copper transport protein n=1 Tax=Chaetoceros debilis TaxID=122233 RepID=A0A7S3Q542_9STRA|mmetsp:Transcript_29558/g.45121  ORF Transcript_29558/g.45121 Transcript_29558/m.45121 type:complete len:281 (+) Transcript_29558:71-913(+)
MEGQHDHSAMMMGGGTEMKMQMNMNMDTDDNAFCQSMESMPAGMAMYMSGFHSSFLSESSLPCLNLFSPHWILDTEFKFFVAMVGVVAMGVAVEALMVVKLRYIVRVEKDRYRNDNELREASNTGESSILPRQRNEKRIQMVLTGFYALHAFLGYMLMLVTMTYSMELMFCTLLGLSMGNFLFYKHKMILSSSSRRGGGSRDNSGDTGAFGRTNILAASSANPCCDFMEQDVNITASVGSGSGSESFDYSRLSQSGGSDNNDEGRAEAASTLHMRAIQSN